MKIPGRFRPPHGPRAEALVGGGGGGEGRKIQEKNFGGSVSGNAWQTRPFGPTTTPSLP